MADSVCWECKYSGDERLCSWVASGIVPEGCECEKKIVGDSINYKNPELITITNCPRFAIDKKCRRSEQPCGSTPIVQMLPFENTVVKIYPSVKQAVKEYGFVPDSFFRAVRNGRLFGGYRWKYYGRKCEKLEYIRYKNNGKIKNYLTAAEAAQEHGTSRRTIGVYSICRKNGWSRETIVDK